MSLTDKFATAGKYGLAGLVGAGVGSGLYHANQTIGLGNVYSKYVIPNATEVASNAAAAGEAIANAAVGLHSLYAGLASSAYTTVTNLLGASTLTNSIAAGGLYGVAGTALAGLSGALVYAGLAYLTYRIGSFALKKTFKLTDYILKAPFRGLKYIANKIIP